MPYSVITQQLKFTTSELQNLPPLIEGFFVLSCYATDEIAQMQRLMIAANANISEQEVTGAFAITQLNSVLRNLSSKLIEYDKALRELGSRGRRQNETEVIDFIQSRAVEYRNLRKGTGYKFAKYLRDKLTNHYLIDNAIEALNRRETKHAHSIYPAQTYINSHYLLGEEILFLDTFSNPDVVGDNFGGSFEDTRRAWMDWITEATRSAQKAHTDYTIMVYKNYFPEKCFERIFIELDKETQVGIIHKSRTPIWWNKAENG